MRVIEVDVVRLQPLQRSLQRRRNLLRRQPARRIHAVELGRDLHVSAVLAGRHPGPEHGLGLPALVTRHPGRIHVGRIDHPTARLVKGVQDRKARLLVGRPAEHVAAQHQPDAAQRGIFAIHLHIRHSSV